MAGRLAAHVARRLARLRIHDFINTQISLCADPQQIARICTGRSVRNWTVPLVEQVLIWLTGHWTGIAASTPCSTW